MLKSLIRVFFQRIPIFSHLKTFENRFFFRSEKLYKKNIRSNSLRKEIFHFFFSLREIATDI